MTNQPIDTILNACENTFEIDLINKASGASFPHVAVQPDNTLGQIYKEYARDLGLNPNSTKKIYENKRTYVSTSDSSETVKSLNLEDGDVLAISDDGGVAADEAPDGSFEIELSNKETGTTVPHVLVFVENTLGQVFQEYCHDLGLSRASKLIFTNKRTGVSTNDTGERIGGLGLQAEDVLMIADDGGVAGGSEGTL